MARTPTGEALYTRRKYLPDGSLNPNYKRHGGKGGRTRGASDAANFIAWDGEGWTVNGRHEYTMLISSRGDELINPNGLDTYSCLLHLLKASTRYPSNARHVIYAGNYDVNMILRDIPRDELRTLWRRKRLTWRGLEIGYRHRKEFSVKLPKLDPATGQPIWKKKRISDPRTGKMNDAYIKVYTASIILWDVLGFFQGSFVNTLRANLAIPQTELDQIQSFKGKRSDFTAAEIDQIRDYCRLEVRWLEQLMVDLARKLRHPSVDLTLSRWDGAGAVAAAIYHKAGTKSYMDTATHRRRVQRPPEHLRRYLADVGMPSVNEAAQFAYSGGRIENVQYGYHDGAIYHYDLVSAYPAAIARLPCLACGKWQWSNDYIPGSYGMWLVQWDYTRPSADVQPYIQPFFLRTNKGNIYYPPIGSGFYWTPEVDAALACTPHDRLQIGGGWVYTTRCDHTPFAFVPDMFRERRRLKDVGDGAQLVLKLGLNSLYGKMIQQIGFNDGRPPYHQLEWGGYVTAWTRSRLYRAAMQDPLAVICIMTDGIYATSPLELNEGDQLGQWEPNVHDAMLCVQAGVYVVRDGDQWGTVKFRGFDKDTFPSVADIRAAYGSGVRSLMVNSTRFIGLGSALASDTLWEEWRQWPTRQRELQLYPIAGRGKRYEIDTPTKRRHPGNQLFRSYPYYDPDAGVTFSAPYDLKWSTDDEGSNDNDSTYRVSNDGAPLAIYNAESEQTECE